MQDFISHWCSIEIGAEQSKFDGDLDNLNFKKFCYVTLLMIEAILCSKMEGTSIHITSQRKGIYIDVTVNDREAVAILLGKKCSNAKAINHLLRFQQIFIHNRYIHLTVKARDDEESKRTVTDKNVRMGK